MKSSISASFLVLLLLPAKFTIAFIHSSRQHHCYVRASPRQEHHSLTSLNLGKPICIYQQLTIQPKPSSDDTNNNNTTNSKPIQAVSVHDLTPSIQDMLSSSNMSNGAIHVISRHTTTSIVINEYESRLARDISQYFLSICPPDERSSSSRRKSGVRYSHNDIDRRPDGEEEYRRCIENGWDVSDRETLRKWREQEPINAHSHLISMMMGSSECIPVVDGEMVIGQWQSVLLVDLDGPRVRSVGVQLMGYE